MNRKILLLFCLIILIVQIVAIIIPRWSEFNDTAMWDNPNKKFEVSDKDGLWNGCETARFISPENTDPKLPKLCSANPPPDYPTYPANSLNAVRLFAISGAILILVSILCLQFMEQNKECQFTCLMMAGVCSLVAVIIYKLKLMKFPESDCKTYIKYKPRIALLMTLFASLMSFGCAGYLYLS